MTEKELNEKINKLESLLPKLSEEPILVRNPITDKDIEVTYDDAINLLNWLKIPGQYQTFNYAKDFFL